MNPQRAHPTLEDLLERSDEAEVASHVANCPSCRAQARLLSSLESHETSALEGLETARQAMEAAREEAGAQLARSLSGRSLGDTFAAVVRHLEPGRVLDRYVVEEPIGRGGMGAVYRVRHRTLGTDHALKVLHAVSPSMARRLVREGRAQGQLQHANVVRVTDVIDVDGLPGLIMEFVPGPSLSSLLAERGVLPLPLVDDLAEQIIAGVAVAHAAGFVHRDLKPANVLLQPRSDGGWTAKISDFGLARHLSDTTQAQLTHPSVPMGTPAFMSPEQGLDARAADVRSDIFSLGATLYELATAQRAFDGDEVVEIYERVRAGDYVDPRTARPDLPRRIARAIRGALQGPRHLRIADCDVLLARWRGEAAGSAGWRLARPGRTAMGLGIAGLLLVGGAGALLQRTLSRGEAPTTAASTVRESRLTAMSGRHQIFSFAVSPRDDTLVWSDDRGLWLQRPDQASPAKLLDGAFQNVDFFPDGERLLLSTEGRGISSVDLEGRDPRQHLPIAGRFVRLAPDGRTVAVSGGQGLVISDLIDGRRSVVRAPPGTGWTLGMAWSPGGEAVATIEEDADGIRLVATAADGRWSRTLVDDKGLAALAMGPIEWLDGDRLLYTLTRVTGDQEVPEVSLYALDGALAGAVGRQARLVHTWRGFFVTQLQATGDASHLTYSRVTLRRQTHLLAVDHPAPPRALSQDDWEEWPLGWWTPEQLLVTSNRAGGGTYLQSVQSGAMTRFAPAIHGRTARVGDDLVYSTVDHDNSAQAMLVRRSTTTGDVHELARFVKAGQGVRCRPAAQRCLIGQIHGDGLQFRTLSTEGGPLSDPILDSDLVAAPSAWDLSWDGRRLAIVSKPGTVVIVDLATGQPVGERALSVQRPVHLAWAPDDARLYVSGLTESESAPYRVVALDADGTETTLWTSATSFLFAPTPSPDGRYLALGGMAFAGDLWSIDGIPTGASLLLDET